MTAKDMFGYHIPGSKPSGKRQLTPAQKLIIWESRPHVCALCGRRIPRLSEAEFDHTRAFSKGGKTSESNIALMHKICNRSKSDKTLARAQLGIGVKSAAKPKKAGPKKRRAKRSRSPFDIDLGFRL